MDPSLSASISSNSCAADGRDGRITRGEREGGMVRGEGTGRRRGRDSDTGKAGEMKGKGARVAVNDGEALPRVNSIGGKSKGSPPPSVCGPT